MRIFLSIAAACAALLSFAPLQAGAVAIAKTVTYRTSYHQTRPLPSGGAYTGAMTLHFAPDGSISGTYRNEYQGSQHIVAGGLTGEKIWLSFGMQGRNQFVGTIGKDGTISGSLTNWRGPVVYEFTAVPTNK